MDPSDEGRDRVNGTPEWPGAGQIGWVRFKQAPAYSVAGYTKRRMDGSRYFFAVATASWRKWDDDVISWVPAHLTPAPE